MLEQKVIHTAAADVLSQEALEQQLATEWAGKQVVFLETVDSTNDEVKRQAEAGAPHGTLIVAEVQTAGKGRMGRSFDSPGQKGIWMSLLIKDDIEPAKASMLTLVMGLAAVKAIETVTDLTPQIKWPNDVIVSGKKLVGILTEMTIKADGSISIILGTGINVHNESFPEEICATATSIFLESGQHISRRQLIDQVLQQFEYYYYIYKQTQDLSNLKDAYNDCLINRGRQVQVIAPKGSYAGVALGINAEGELLVETEQEVRRVSSGEVSVRGVLGYV